MPGVCSASTGRGSKRRAMTERPNRIARNAKPTMSVRRRGSVMWASSRGSHPLRRLRRALTGHHSRWRSSRYLVTNDFAVFFAAACRFLAFFLGSCSSAALSEATKAASDTLSKACIVPWTLPVTSVSCD